MIHLMNCLLKLCSKLLFLVLILSAVCSAENDSEILTLGIENHEELNVSSFEEDCIRGCDYQNRTDDDLYDMTCNVSCNIEQCSRGCSLWLSALETPCQTVCNGTQEPLPPKQLYCVMGCNNALNRYFQKLRSELGPLPAPALVADSLTATSLRLEWSWSHIESINRVTEAQIARKVDRGGTESSHVRYLVQWKYEELADEWQYYRNQTWNSQQNTVFVDNLQPYTKYRFRVAVLLSRNYHGEPIVSDPSVVISTLKLGEPASPPIITRVVAIDSSRISVSWEPGPFPNGPILSYVLQITPADDKLSSLQQNTHHEQAYPVLKDIPASGGTDFYMVNNLAPSRKYSVSISMRNSVGKGPSATVTVVTPEENTVKDTQQSMLILGTNVSVLQQSVDILEEPTILYNTSDIIKGVAIHVSKKLLFISNSAGYVLQSSLIKYTTPIPILKPDSINFLPMDLSVDWLNDQLYILSKVKNAYSNQIWQIFRCGLDGKSVTVAVAGFPTKPHHIEVDPYNGYLFWVNGFGLFRLDLADISNGVRREIIPLQIFNSSHLGAFTVDHTNFRLLVPHHGDNTVLSVSLDGREVVDLRRNTQTPMFKNVSSLVMAKGLFYWLNGGDLIAEEYHQGIDSYYHNKYPVNSNGSFITLSVNLLSCQPIPLPVNPPTEVQAIFSYNKAKIAWKIPHLLGGQGKGAWQNWLYDLLVYDSTNQSAIHYRNINTTSFTVHKLQENTNYVFKTAAYTKSGSGPFSSEFNGKTLSVPKNGKLPLIIWSADEGLLVSDVTGDNIKTLIHKTNMKGYHVTYMSWYNDRLYLVTNTSNVFRYNLNKQEKYKLTEIDSIQSIAVDWLGKKLYWSNPKQQLIIRGNFNGSQHEPLPIVALAQELKIDSIHAYIYWSTGYAVESARLNGAEKKIYYTTQLFSIKRVMGITLDITNNSLYWIIRSYEGSILFRAPTAEKLPVLSGNEVPADLLQQVHFQQYNMQGSLCFFSQRLLWLQDNKNAVIGDLNGYNAGVLAGISHSKPFFVTVMDESLHVLPNVTDHQDLNVIPESISNSNIYVVGSWDLFNISWEAVSNVNYGEIFYEIKIINFEHSEIMATSKTNSFKYPYEIPPYSNLEVIIRPYTYWGSAAQTRISLKSPSSVPTKPENLRAFIQFDKKPFTEKNITGILRWQKPAQMNGLLLGYIINCYYLSEDDDFIPVCKDVIVEPDIFEFTQQTMFENKTYRFEVQAFTKIGKSLISKVFISTQKESIIPRLLITSDDTVLIKDLDNNTTKIVCKSNGKIIDISYIFTENTLVWINDLQELFMYDLETNIRTKLKSLNSPATSLTVDWVKRCLYWVQYDYQNKKSTILSLDLNVYIKHLTQVEKIIEIPSYVYHLEVSPFVNTLYWTEAFTNKTNHISYINLNDNTQIDSYSTSDKTNCNCPLNPNVEKAFFIDHSNITNIRIHFYYIDNTTKYIINSDIDFCKCDIIENTPDNVKSLTAEYDRLYILNDEYIYKISESNIQLFGNDNFNTIRTYGSHMQPYSNDICLKPEQLPLIVEVANKTANSLTLKMPDPIRDFDCRQSSMPSVVYSVYYKAYSDEDSLRCDENCSIIVTFEKELKIDNLRPFSKYLLSVALDNYYSKLSNDQSVIGIGTVVQTAAGAPSRAQNLTATVVTPTLVNVTWLPPEEINDETVMYEIHYQLDGTVEGVRPKGEKIVNQTNLENKRITEILKLLPNQTYEIWIRSFSINSKTYTDTKPVQIQTYAEPYNVTFISASPYTLNVSWKISNEIINYEMEYTEIDTEEWVKLNTSNHSEENALYFISNLLPKTKYIFRLILTYPKYNSEYIWPTDTRFTFETLGDKPSQPGVPIVQHVRSDVYQVIWNPSRENGAPITVYRLEGRSNNNENNDIDKNYQSDDSNSDYKGSISDISDSNLEGSMFLDFDENKNFAGLKWKHGIQNENALNYSRNYIKENWNEEIEEEWITYYNGTENYWLIRDLSIENKYWFRVFALNSFGWSEASETSDLFEPTTGTKEAILAQKPQQFTMVLIISILFFVTVFSGLAYVICLFKRHAKDKKAPQKTSPITSFSPDVELATLRDMPHGQSNATLIHSVLYTSSDGFPTISSDSLPHISRDQITLMKFLGSGAFGEVYEGKATCINDVPGDTRVAVKTLRKGASSQERAEFLREAQLMAQFHHPHILRLLGVCRDNDPNFIIMELMEAGDLLSYLRSSRPLLTTPEALTLFDLFSMCVDVARGCHYLEEQHFVHRDLACRNCLVSSSEPIARVVKIGDFGLARDIYKNDYYRKEGEGLLPVRWMAPESLVDGVFTSQSDVWAFGVLIWEIMTLGQQPYPARTNLEVLHYVRNGGRLHRPNNCYEELHKLMLQCWSYNPEHRPTFKHCLEVLEKLKVLSRENSIPLIVNFENSTPHYITTVGHNAIAADDRTNQERQIRSRPISPVQETEKNTPSKEMPKYLEVICSEEEQLPSLTSTDGYEVPRASFRSTKSLKPAEFVRTPSISSTVSSEVCSDMKPNIKHVSSPELEKLFMNNGVKPLNRLQQQNKYYNNVQQPLLVNVNNNNSTDEDTTALPKNN